MSQVLDGYGPQGARPVVGYCTDGIGLFYAGQVNVLFGDPESGKTMLALAVAASVLNSGRRVAIIDLDHNGVATAGEADIAKRLIEQWGGKLAADINVNTDFVVIGAEPVVPNLSKEEESDPLLVQRRTQAQADLTQYQDVINKARDLHIPILNQNRFLYFIGYYDQAKR